MFSPDRRIHVEFDLKAARRRADEYLPFSPAWDAAMARVEDLERLLWLLDRAVPMPALVEQSVGAPGHANDPHRTT